MVDDLSNWYVRVNRARFWAPDGEADPAAVATLRECLTTVSRLLAPAAPFASDWMHRALAGGSVHLAGWPEARTDGEGGERYCPGPRDGRASAGSRRWPGPPGRTARLKVRQPLATMQVAVPPAVRGPVFDALLRSSRPR